MVSQLLYDLPSNEAYRVLFMERDADEMLASQECWRVWAGPRHPATP